MNDNPVLTESTYYILLSLCTPQHGYGIMQRTEALSGGRVRLGPATLYTILDKFLTEGYLEEIAVEGRKRTYRLTEAGLMAYHRELGRLRRCLEDAVPSRAPATCLTKTERSAALSST